MRIIGSKSAKGKLRLAVKATAHTKVTVVETDHRQYHWESHATTVDKNVVVECQSSREIDFSITIGVHRTVKNKDNLSQTLYDLPSLKETD